MLNGVLTLHDIRDTEAFCATIIRRSRIDLTPLEHEDLLAYLIEQAWTLSTRYDRGDPRYPPRFSVIATERLRNRITDWLRTNRNDNRYPTRYTTTPLNDQLADTLTTSPLDDPAHSHTDLPRLLRTRDRSNDRPYPHLDTRPTQRAA